MAGLRSASVDAQGSCCCPQTPGGSTLMSTAVTAETTAPCLSLFELQAEIGLLQHVFAQDTRGLPLHRDLLMRQTRRKPENRFAIDLAAGQKRNFTLQRDRTETQHPQHAGKEDAHRQPCGNRRPHRFVLPPYGSCAREQQGATCSGQ